MEGSDQLERGRAAFNCGDYFSAHELWEDVWLGLVGDERIFLQGLIQIARDQLSLCFVRDWRSSHEAPDVRPSICASIHWFAM
jgi:predicted metal-dependent hydrolase